MSIPTVAVVAFNDFSLFHLSVPCIIFGDILPGRKLFELKVCPGESGLIRSKLGLNVETDFGLDDLARAEIVVIPFWRGPEEKPSQEILDALKSVHERGGQLVGLCLGTYVLAHSGVLNNRKAVTHWEFEEDFFSRFPGVSLDTNSLYVDDGRIITSAGTGASLDCCLYLVRQYYGSAIANQVSRRMVIPPYRDGGQTQFIEQPVPVSTRDARVNGLLDYLRGNLQKTHDLDSLACHTMMSRRTFTRHFQKATGMSVGEWLLVERLNLSKELLESTSHSIEKIAELVGFHSTVSLRQHFRTAFEVSPSEWRKIYSFSGRY